ncbi:MAG: hypothetical protein MZU95_08010 [Desulfomicrobium escambiense]|nr:hypothetical protein [Desulfomicrobium escambiense]
MLVVGGPGIAAKHFRIGDHYHQIYGSLDHLGTETSALDEADLEEAINSCFDQDVRVWRGLQIFAAQSRL